jgi:hypothetical protein
MGGKEDLFGKDLQRGFASVAQDLKNRVESIYQGQKAL